MPNQTWYNLVLNWDQFLPVRSGFYKESDIVYAKGVGRPGRPITDERGQYNLRPSSRLHVLMYPNRVPRVAAIYFYLFHQSPANQFFLNARAISSVICICSYVWYVVWRLCVCGLRPHLNPEWGPTKFPAQHCSYHL